MIRKKDELDNKSISFFSLFVISFVNIKQPSHFLNLFFIIMLTANLKLFNISIVFLFVYSIIIYNDTIKE